MPFTREELETRERQTLAPYAQLSADSRGRQHPEPPADWRTHYQRDRDRVIHSRAFRRLEYKTQVFLNGTGDHLRTRLTHTLEVAAIARDIARAAGLRYAYIGNVRGIPDAETTFCPGCRRPVIERDLFAITRFDLAAGKCKFCQAKIAGVWA